MLIFILSPIENEDQIEYEQVTRTIKEYLDSIGEGSNFTIVTDSKKVLIKSINGKKK